MFGLICKRMSEESQILTSYLKSRCAKNTHIYTGCSNIKMQTYCCKKVQRNVEANSGSSSGLLRQRRHRNSDDSAEEGINQKERFNMDKQDEETERWRRILLLIVAITVHNIPEGLAVGVGFGAVGQSEKSTFENARNLAIGIGNFFLKLQHFM